MKILVFFCAVLFVCLNSLFSAEINVPADYSTIQAAIDAAGDGDIITVMPGRYYEKIDMSGKDITLQSTDPSDPAIVEATIIDGNDSGSVIVCASGEDSNTVINCFTITNGSGTVIENNSCGGGMYNNSSSPTLTNCTFSVDAANSRLVINAINDSIIYFDNSTICVGSTKINNLIIGDIRGAYNIELNCNAVEGDLAGDGVVSMADLVMLAANWLSGL